MVQHNATAAALYQVGEGIFERFDKVLLIDQGHCLYFGPSNGAVSYFRSLGFIKPDRWTTSDFLISITDPKERMHEKSWTCEDLAQSYRNSELCTSNALEADALLAQNQEDLALRLQANVIQPAANFSAPFWRQTYACSRRHIQVMLGDRVSLANKWGGITFQGLMIGGLFINLPHDTSGIYPRGGMLWMLLMNNALLALAELTASFEGRPIMFKHKNLGFHRPAAFAVAQTIADIPLVLIQVSLSVVTAYFMANLRRTAAQFFTLFLFLWLTTMVMYAFFRAIGAMFGSLDNATKVTGVAVQALITYTGYLIPPTKMQVWLRWLIYVNPVSYCFEALLANEYHGTLIPCVPPYIVPDVAGASPRYQTCNIQGSQPGSLVVSGDRYIQTA